MVAIGASVAGLMTALRSAVGVARAPLIQFDTCGNFDMTVNVAEDGGEGDNG